MTPHPSIDPPADSSTAKERAAAHSELSMVYRNILVPVDFSANSEKAVWYAAKLASGYDAMLLHVFQTPFHASLPYQGTRLKVDQIQSYASAAEQQAKEELDELLGQLQKKGIKVAACLQSGYPFEQIIE